MSVLIPRMTLEFKCKRIDVRLLSTHWQYTWRHIAHASCTTTFCLCKSCQRTLFLECLSVCFPEKRVQRYSFSVNWQNVFATFFEKCPVLGGLIDGSQRGEGYWSENPAERSALVTLCSAKNRRARWHEVTVLTTRRMAGQSERQELGPMAVVHK